MKAASLIELIALPELKMLQAVDGPAAARKAKRMAGSQEDFMRGALPLVAPWLARHTPAGCPWVWAVGDAHHGNFATLAVGRADRDGIVPVTYGVADVDDEGPAPWTWDLLRLLSSLAIAQPDLKRSAFEELAGLTVEAYRECLGRLAEGDALAARIDANGLPEALKSLIASGQGEAAHKRFMTGFVSKGTAGARTRLRRGDDVTDDPQAAECLRAAWAATPGLPEHEVLDLARRRNPGGLSSLGRRRWWLLLRETGGESPRLRLVELKERGPGALSRVVPLSPFAPWGTVDGHIGSSTMGGDPYQRVLRVPAGEYLARTRCHTRQPLPLAGLDGGDRRRLGHLHGQLLATFHWQGLGRLAPDVAERGRAVVGAAAGQGPEIARLAGRLSEHLRELAEAYAARVAPLIRKGKAFDDLVLDE